ncbi:MULTISPECIES: HalOD1 output domain-containing protein [Haloferacaceae]|uniref:HalOD1 output domain-containing protein n=1 Tax=Halorubrum glutamatedens TaxID=2707018 RepID=A0ABD5QSG4_9EURY|nr:HalOD1 output domain-containing protein [Halobellus captivus]
MFERAEDTSVCVAIVEAVSTVTGTEPTRLDPLYGVVDTDALERLVESGGTDTEITFSFEGCRITVFGDGGVVVTDPN